MIDWFLHQAALIGPAGLAGLWVVKAVAGYGVLRLWQRRRAGRLQGPEA